VFPLRARDVSPRLFNNRYLVQTTLYIGTLDSQRDSSTAKRLLSVYGRVLHFKLVAHPVPCCPHSGFAIAKMETEEDAQAAVLMLDGSAHFGTRLTVRAATAREETAAGHPRFFGTMNMIDDPEPPRSI
jgi:RNA recognition motif-containing protein